MNNKFDIGDTVLCTRMNYNKDLSPNYRGFLFTERCYNDNLYIHKFKTNEFFFVCEMLNKERFLSYSSLKTCRLVLFEKKNKWLQ